jgi:hypothetical protein
MSERIKELKLQAGIQDNPDQEGLDLFAELIVRECADLCDRFQARDVGMQPAECAGAIRAMFGVKE